MSVALYSVSRRDAEKKNGDAEMLRHSPAPRLSFSASLREPFKAPHGAGVMA